MDFAIAVFVGVFLLIAVAGVLLFHRRAMVHRISSAINPTSPKSRSFKERREGHRLLVGGHGGGV